MCARLVFSLPFLEGKAPAVLRDATFDVVGRLCTVLQHGFTTHGSPDVKAPSQRHHCRHRWRLLLGEGPVFLSLSTHHREGGLALPYLWSYGRPALVCQVAWMFAP